MDKSMRAAVYLGPEKIEIRRVPIPILQTGEILVRVRAATTCGTDVKTYRRGHPKFPPPLVFGHEFAGDVVAAGAEVSDFQPGMRVTSNVFAECGECFFCLKGQGNLCERLEYNLGAFAEYIRIPASIVRVNTFVLPDHLSYAQAAMLEPLVTVVSGQRKISIQPGERVAIIGSGGAVGLMHQQCALIAGAQEVIAVGHSDYRLGIARQLGAAHLVNARDEEPVGRIRELTGGYGADVVIECAGTLDAWQSAVQAVRKGGRVLWFGGLPGGSRIELDAVRIHYEAIDLYNTHGGTSGDARRAFELLASGAIDVRSLITGEFPLEQVEDALQQMIAGEAIKLVIIP